MNWTNKGWLEEIFNGLLKLEMNQSFEDSVNSFHITSQDLIVCAHRTCVLAPKKSVGI